jgi:hypothetical protein
MSLITMDELARGAVLVVGGGAAGLFVMIAPGSALWLVPAALTVAGMGLTVPEVRSEVQRALPQLADNARQIRGLLPDRNQRPAAPRATATPQRPPVAPVSPAAQKGNRRTQVQDAPPGLDLVQTLEDTPHRLIIGHTRGGKTTLIHHMATQWAARGERVLVGDPDAAPGLWPGCTVAGAGDNIAQIGELMNVVAGEVETRRILRSQGVRRFEPLHLVIDEAQDVLPVIPGGLELFEDVARRGGKLNIRMTVGVQDKQVETLGLKGKSEVLRNLQIADVLKNRDGRRVAVVRDAETGEKISIPIPQLTDPETLIISPAQVAAPAPRGVTQSVTAPVQGVSGADAAVSIDALDLLDSLLAQPVSNASGRQDTPAPVPASVPNRTVTDTGTDTPSGAVSLTLERDGGHLTLNVNARAEAAPADRPTGRTRTRKGRAFDARRRRLANQAQSQDAQKATLQQAYEQRKAAGVSYRKAFAELGGSSEETRGWWRAAPEPATPAAPAKVIRLAERRKQ